jgi:uncharacterized protein
MAPRFASHDTLSPLGIMMACLRILLLLSVALPSGFHAMVAQDPSRQPPPVTPHVEAIGHGEARVAPDRATITLAVETKGPSAATVAAQNARVQRRVLDTLRALGFAESAVSTLNYNVGPNYEQGAREMRQVGYVAHNAITVRVAQLERIGAIIDAALARGATQVQNVSFESSRADSARRAALAEASAEARADAEAIARAMGGSLGALLDATTSRDYPMLARMRSYSGVGGGRINEATQITPATLEVQAIVSARWRFVTSP